MTSPSAASAMLAAITANVSASLSVGLNSITSVPAVTTGTWPGRATYASPARKVSSPSAYRKRQLATDHDTPMRALAAIVGQAPEHRRAVRVDVVLLEHDGEVVELGLSTREHFGLHRNRRLRPY